jgi:hypothetical protein
MVAGFTTTCAITKVMRVNPIHGEVYWIQHYVIKWFSSGTLVFSTNKTDCHDITGYIVESGAKHHKPNHQN